MMKKTLTSAEAEEVIAAELSVSPSVVRDTVRRLREADRISSGRKATFTSRELARIILALSANRAVTCVAAEMQTGDLPRTAGDGAINAETELTDLLDQAAGLAGGDIDFRSGDIFLSEGGFMTVAARRFEGDPVTRIYKRGFSSPDRMTRLALIPLPLLKRLATQIII